MLYRVIGVDGREYGPASAEVVREWILQRRVDGQTRAQRVGEAGWLPLSAFPEFSRDLAGAPLTSGGAGNMNSMAQAGFIFGIFSVTLGYCCCYGVPFNLLGLVFSLIGLSQINANPQQQQGRGLAIAGLVLSSLSLMFTALIWLLHGTHLFLQGVQPRMWHI